VVVGSFAFLGFDGFVAVAVGLVPAGCAAAGLGLAPPVDGAGVAVGAELAGAEDVAAGAAATAVEVVDFLGCWAVLCCLAW
jgi:hypothetical protein